MRGGVPVNKAEDVMEDLKDILEKHGIKIPKETWRISIGATEECEGLRGERYPAQASGVIFTDDWTQAKNGRLLVDFTAPSPSCRHGCPEHCP